MLKQLSELKTTDIAEFGRKAVNLGLLYENGFNVPNGYAVGKSITDKIRLNNYHLNDDVLYQLKEVYNQFKRVVVRSSAIAEDSARGSFAGQYETVLDIADFESYISAITTCIKSSEKINVDEYAKKMNIEEHTEIALIIQPMIAGEASGVLFTADPITGNRKNCIINAAKGLGTGVVDGTSELERYVVSDKVEITEASSRVMLDKQLFELGRIGKSIGKYFTRPQDIEWTIKDGEIYILQSRDITTLYPVDEDCLTDEKLRLYLCYNTVVQGMKEPFTPLGFEFWQATFAGYTSVFFNFKKKIRKPAWIKLINGRIYYDLTEILGRRIIGKNAIGGFDDKDPACGDLIKQLYDRHRLTFLKQGGKFRLSYGIVKWGLTLQSYGKISRKNISEALEEAHGIGQDYISNLKDRILKTESISSKVNLMEKVTEELLTLGFKQVMYIAYGLKAIDKQEKWLKEKYPDLNFEVLKKAVNNNPTTEMGIELLEIAQKVTIGEIEHLETSTALSEFLLKYGHRSQLDIDMGIKRWHENPDYILDLIRLYSKHNPEEKLNRIYNYRKEADELRDEIFDKVSKDFGEKKAIKVIFDINNYRTLSGLREQPKFIAVKVLSMLREMFVDIGNDFVKENKLSDANDISYLYTDEILNPDEHDLRLIVETRKLEYQSQNAYSVIPRIILSNGETYVYPQMDSNHDLSGVPISSGRITGTVRVLNTPDTKLVCEGDIIVTHNTDPSWTPLFSLVKGLIMESGGPISHGAIVAREFGLPGIAGVTDAVTRLKNGDVITMDGTTGQIEIINRV